MKATNSLLRSKVLFVLLSGLAFLSCKNQKVNEKNIGTIDSVRFEYFSENKMKIIFFKDSGFVIDPMSPISDEAKRFNFYHVKYGTVFSNKDYLCEKNYNSVKSRFRCHKIKHIK